VYSAVVLKNEERIRELIECCAKGELPYSIFDQEDEEGFTPLHYACILKLHNIIALLLEVGVDVTIPDSRGLTALHWSALLIDDSALSLVCANVFDTDLYDHRNRTPLYLACVEGRDANGCVDYSSARSCINILTALGADVNHTDELGYSIVQHMAASWQCVLLDSLLSTDSVELGVKSPRTEQNLLHLVCSASSLKVLEHEVDLLLGKYFEENSDESAEGHNARRSSRLFAQCSMLDMASPPEALRMVRTLLAQGVPPNAKDAFGNPPLEVLANNFLCFQEELSAIIELLIASGARAEDCEAFSSLRSQYVAVRDAADRGLELWEKRDVIDGDALSLQ
jgi:ankyrin repeat protein